MKSLTLRLLYYKLNLNLYLFNFKKSGLNNSLLIRAWTNLNFLNNYVLFNNYDQEKNKIIIVFDFKYYFWRLYFIKYFFLKIKFKKSLKNLFMFLIESNALFNVVLYFSKKFNQQYLFGWFPGLVTNRNMLKSYIIKNNLFYLYNFFCIPEFIILIENSNFFTKKALQEFSNYTSSLPIVFFSIFDMHLSEISFITKKSEIKVYFYLSLVFEIVLNNSSYKK